MMIHYIRDDRGFPKKCFDRMKGAVGSIVLMGTLFLFNIIQCLSLVFAPVSRWLVWKINRECAQLWWSFLVFWVEKVLGVEITITGDQIPYGEKAFLIANHQQMPDIPVLMALAIRKGRLGDMKWFVKDALKYIPGIGWGMYFLGCVFLKRNWYSDQARIRKTFARLKDLGIPFWLVSFVEGTRITPAKLKRAQEYAASRGYPVPQHTLIPRRKGFTNAIEGIGESIDAVYDATIFYEDGIPTLWQMAQGMCRRVRLEVRRYPIASLPKGEEALAEWLRLRYYEKDGLLMKWEKEIRK